MKISIVILFSKTLTSLNNVIFNLSVVYTTDTIVKTITVLTFDDVIIDATIDIMISIIVNTMTQSFFTQLVWCIVFDDLATKSLFSVARLQQLS